jgi:energy-coupling factor transport system permease protein
VGQYVPGKTRLHHLDPRTKLVAGVALMAVLFWLSSPASLLPLGASLAALSLVTGTSWRFWLNGLRPVLPVALVSLLFQAVLTPGAPLTHYANWPTLEGIEHGGVFALRMLILVQFTSLVSVTTSPIRLCDALEKLLWPLSKLRLPVHDIALASSIALRFIPTLAIEAERVWKAQLSRGAPLESGPLPKRLKAFVSILVPLFVRAFRYADDLALAMEARGYVSGGKRSRLHPLQLTRIDALALLLWMAWLAGLATLESWAQ